MRTFRAAVSSLRRAGILAAALVLAPALAPRAAAASGWTVQLAVGFPFDLSLPLTIRQRGEATIHTRPSWETRPFEAPLYYDLRVSRWSEGREWSIELLHHKLFLTDPPPEVQRFDISHGYNLVLVSHAREVARDTWLRGGAGLVVAHPETVVRGREREGGGPFGGGYHPAGPALAFGVERRLFVAGGAFLSVQGLVTASWARVPVADGDATVRDVSFHALGGVGFATGR